LPNGKGYGSFETTLGVGNPRVEDYTNGDCLGGRRYPGKIE